MPDDDALTPEGEEPEIPNAADEAGQRKVKRESRRSKEQAKDFWRRVLADPIGPREIWALLQSCHTFEERFACGPNGFPQVEATWFEAGQQAFGQRLYQTLILYDREAVFKMHDQFDPRFAKPKAARKDED